MISLGVGFGIVVALALLIWVRHAYQRYKTRPLPARTWNTITLNNIPATFMLSTEWTGERLLYQFRIKPQSVLSDATATDLSDDLVLIVSLRDKAGFTVCRWEEANLIEERNSRGQVYGFAVGGVADEADCTLESYLTADSWNVRVIVPSEAELQKILTEESP